MDESRLVVMPRHELGDHVSQLNVGRVCGERAAIIERGAGEFFAAG